MSRLADPSSPVLAPALLTEDQAAQYLGVGSRKFRELRGEAWMCAPILLGPRHQRWSRAELDAAIAAMPRQAAKPDEPAQLARARIDRMKATGSAS